MEILFMLMEKIPNSSFFISDFHNLSTEDCFLGILKQEKSLTYSLLHVVRILDFCLISEEQRMLMVSFALQNLAKIKDEACSTKAMICCSYYAKLHETRGGWLCLFYLQLKCPHKSFSSPSSEKLLVCTLCLVSLAPRNNKPNLSRRRFSFIPFAESIHGLISLKFCKTTYTLHPHLASQPTTV